MDSKKKVVITGSQGSLGRILRKGLEDYFSILCIDINSNDTSIIKVDIASEYERLKSSIKNCDVIIHLAWNSKEDYPNENIKTENKIMSENIYRAAMEVGVPRVIMASSVHANDYSNASKDKKISADDQCWPDTPYGVTKSYIEHLGRFYARHHGLEVVCVRLGGVNNNNEIRYEEDSLYDKVLLYREDFIELIRQCVITPAIPFNFAVLYGVSDNAERVHTLENFLNWKPEFPKK